MKLSESDINLIEKYFDKNLTSEEQRILNEKVSHSIEFKNLLDQTEKGIKSLDEVHKKEIRNEFRDYLDASKKPRVSKSIRIQSVFKYAAVIFILLSSSLILWKWNNNPENLFDQYYEPYPASVILRGEEKKTTKPIPTQLYTEGLYEQAVPMLLKEYQLDNTLETHILLIGNCYLNLNDASQAIKTFSNDDIKDPIILQTCNWYKALANIKNNEYQHAEIILTDIVKRKEIYADQSADLLRELKK